MPDWLSSKAKALLSKSFQNSETCVESKFERQVDLTFVVWSNVQRVEQINCRLDVNRKTRWCRFEGECGKNDDDVEKWCVCQMGRPIENQAVRLVESGRNSRMWADFKAIRSSKSDRDRVALVFDKIRRNSNSVRPGCAIWFEEEKCLVSASRDCCWKRELPK